MTQAVNHTQIMPLAFSGASDEMITTALSCFEKSGAVLKPFLELPFSLSLNVMRDNGTDGPTFIFSGPESFTARYFGEEFARDCAGKDAVPDKAFAMSICDGFRECSWTGEPVLERIKAKTQGKWVHYDRALFPAELGNGAPTFVALLRPLRVLQEVHPTASGSPVLQAQPENGFLGNWASGANHVHSARRE